MVDNYNEMLHDNETIELSTIILRRFRGGDAEDILEYASDEKTVKHLMWAGVKTIQEARASIYDYYLSRPGIYAIELKENAKCIGCIDIRLNTSHERAEFGYVLNRNYWGLGIMSAALEGVLALCFDKLGLNRVEAGYFTGNEASGRVMEKCGMVKEGVARKVLKVKGSFRDEVRYGITRDEWTERDLSASSSLA